MNTYLRKKTRNDFEKDFFFTLMNDAVFGKTMKMQKNIEINNLSQWEKEGTIWYQNQIVIL